MTVPVRRLWGLRTVLAGSLVLLALLLGGALLALALREVDRMAAASARALLDQQAREAARLFSDRLAHAQGLVQAGTRWGPLLRPDLRAALEGRWAAELGTVPGLSAVRVALGGGGAWVQMLAVPEGEAPPTLLQAVPGTRLALFSAGAGAPTGQWQFLDPAGAVLLARAGAPGPAAEDGRAEPWHAQAMASEREVASDVRLLPLAQAPGLTLARALADGTGVVSVDVDLQDLGPAFARLAATPGAALALVDPTGRVAAWGGGAAAGPVLRPLALLAEAGDAALPVLAAAAQAGTEPDAPVAGPDGVPRLLAQASVAAAPSGGAPWHVLAYAPLADAAGPAAAARGRLLALAAVLGVLVLAVAAAGAHRIAADLRRLRDGAQRLQRMDFGEEAAPVASRLREVAELSAAQASLRTSLRGDAEALQSARQRLELLIDAGLRMARERDRLGLLQQVLWSARQVAHCDAVTLYTVTEQRTLRFALRTRDDALPAAEIPLYDAEGRENTQFVSVYAALRNTPVVIDDVYLEPRFDLSGTRSFDAQTGYRTVSMLALPLAPREGQVIGVLQLMNATDPRTGRTVGFDAESQRLAAALAAQAAVSLDNHQLVRAHEDMVEAMVRLLADAVDAKSPHTSGHCARVPELAFMLAEEAGRATRGPLAGFGFATPQEWREFRIGAWLHDCGKITTPEYVVDKATKLQTLHDRIHEVRTRFEVLWRDAEIDCLQARLDGQDAAAAAARRDVRQAALLADFAFVAACNLGGESMDDLQVARLHAIGAQTWWRHFDDRLGISHAARTALRGVPEQPPPALERLLDDKPEHIVARPAGGVAQAQLRHGFHMNVPEHLYHHGELHNLSVRRGTLTPEERFKINEHIMQTIAMLEAIPFPPQLQRVPEYAGTHHEALHGGGYPRGLTAAQLSVPARIMAVADIFEALTAADRPYRTPKKLSEAVELLWGFKQRGHIDPDVFDLLLQSGAYLRYARRFLAPELIDRVDVARYLGPVPAPAPAAAEEAPL